MKEKLARETTALVVTTGSKIRKRLKEVGPSEMPRLNIIELYALLVNAVPQGSIPKPNKKTRQEKVNLVPNAQAALRRFFGGCMSKIEAPSVLPIAFAPMICEGEHIKNSQKWG